MLVLKNGHWVKVAPNVTAGDLPAMPMLNMAVNKTMAEHAKKLALAGDLQGLLVLQNQPTNVQKLKTYYKALVTALRKKGIEVGMAPANTAVKPAAKPAAVKPEVPEDLGPLSTLKKSHLIKVQHAMADGDIVALEKLASDAHEMVKEDIAMGVKNGKWTAIAEYSQAALDYAKGGQKGTTIADLEKMDPPKRAPKVTGAKAKPTPANAAAGEPIAMAGWTKTAGQKGYNEGGFFKDPAGQDWYLQIPGRRRGRGEERTAG